MKTKTAKGRERLSRRSPVCIREGSTCIHWAQDGRGSVFYTSTVVEMRCFWSPWRARCLFLGDMGAANSSMGVGASTVLATEDTLRRLGRFAGPTHLPYGDAFWCDPRPAPLFKEKTPPSKRARATDGSVRVEPWTVRSIDRLCPSFAMPSLD